MPVEVQAQVLRILRLIHAVVLRPPQLHALHQEFVTYPTPPHTFLVIAFFHALLWRHAVRHVEPRLAEGEPRSGGVGGEEGGEGQRGADIEILVEIKNGDPVGGLSRSEDAVN